MNSVKTKNNVNVQFGLPSYEQMADVINEGLQQLPVCMLLDILEESLYKVDLLKVHISVLFNPNNMKRLASDPHCRERVARSLRWMHKCDPHFISLLTLSFVQMIKSSNRKSYVDPIGFCGSLHMGRLFIEGGWYAEAICILRLTMRQARNDVTGKLQALELRLLAESLSCRIELARQTLREIDSLKRNVRTSPQNLVASVNNTVSISHFEQGNFASSYVYVILAFQQLDGNEKAYPIIIAILRQMMKCCVVKRKFKLAKLMITQAVSWAWHLYGSGSVRYAETLEDYALYLLLMNAYKDCLQVEEEAKTIYHKQCGHLSLQPEYGHGNTALRMYLECCNFHRFGAVTEDVGFILDIDSEHFTAVDHPDDRQVLALKRMRIITKVIDMVHGGSVKHPKPLDNVTKVQPKMSFADIRQAFLDSFQ